MTQLNFCVFSCILLIYSFFIILSHILFVHLLVCFIFYFSFPFPFFFYFLYFLLFSLMYVLFLTACFRSVSISSLCSYPLFLLHFPLSPELSTKPYLPIPLTPINGACWSNRQEDKNTTPTNSNLAPSLSPRPHCYWTTFQPLLATCASPNQTEPPVPL